MLTVLIAVGPHQSAQRGEVALVLRRAALHKRGEVFGATQQPGQRKSKSDHKSDSRFSMGVPLRATR